MLGNFVGYFNEHSDVHLWYHGTIDITGAIDDGSASVAADAGWYAGAMGPRDQIGYYFSRAVGGARPATGLATGLADGQAARVPINHAADRWPSLLDVQLLAQPLLAVGVPLDVRYAWHDHDSNASLEFFLDNDRNPFNGTGPQLGFPLTVAQTSPALLSTDQVSLSTTGLDAGSYELFARISDATGHRVLYADDGVELQETALTVTEFLPTSSGFVAEFSSELEASVLNLYDSESAAAGAQSSRP